MTKAIYEIIIIVLAFAGILGNAQMSLKSVYNDTVFYTVHWTVTGLAVVAMFAVTLVFL